MPSLATKPKPSHYPKLLNTLGDHIRRRLDLGLFQSTVAEPIGVDPTTIHNWEGNKSLPAIRYIPAILRFLGYNPFPSARTFPEQLATVRRMLGCHNESGPSHSGWTQGLCKAGKPVNTNPPEGT
jgi:DNA-binding XRE family transcriptional regulator